MTIVAITVVGNDRAGLVNALAECVAGQEGNWLRSHMANLAGQFAGVIEIEIPESSINALRETLEARCGQNLDITLAKAGAASQAAPGQTLVMEILGQDHPGIVRDITRVLASHGISVEELETESYSGSMSAEMMFSANARLIVPPGVSTRTLDSALQELSNSLMVDITLDTMPD